MKAKKKRLRILVRILKSTNTDKMLLTYLCFVLLDALVIWILEPQITSYPDALWYCYAVGSTVGFGDMVTTSFLPKMLSVLLTIYTLLVTAIVTGVLTNYYTQTIESNNEETVTAFMDRLERLEELSPEELKELSGKIKKFRENRRTDTEE